MPQIIVDSLFHFYLQELRQYWQLLIRLSSSLEPLIKLKEIDHEDYRLLANQSSISEAIKFMYRTLGHALPPAAWIEPRKGNITIDDSVWGYSFHGAGLSFVQLNASRWEHDISGEYSVEGLLAITAWTTQVYFETARPKTPLRQEVIDNHEMLFSEAIQQRYLTAVRPLLQHDEATFVFQGEEYRK